MTQDAGVGGVGVSPRKTPPPARSWDRGRMTEHLMVFPDRDDADRLAEDLREQHDGWYDPRPDA